MTKEDYKLLCNKNEETVRYRKAFTTAMQARIENVNVKQDDILLMYKDYKILRGYALSDVIEMIQEGMLCISNMSKLKALIK